MPRGGGIKCLCLFGQGFFERLVEGIRRVAQGGGAQLAQGGALIGSDTANSQR